jgi:hypothetical protein
MLAASLQLKFQLKNTDQNLKINANFADDNNQMNLIN